MSSVHTTAYQRLVAATAAMKVPDAVYRVATAPPQDPRPGQIWRAVWEDTIQLLLITTAGDGTARVVPPPSSGTPTPTPCSCPLSRPPWSSRWPCGGAWRPPCRGVCWTGRSAS